MQKTAIWVTLALGCLIIQEFAVRLALPDLDPTKHLQFTQTADGITLGPPNTVRRQIKNTGDFNVLVRFNELGLRDEKFIADAEPDDFYMLGDSFGFGWGVSAAERLSNQLDVLIGPRIFNLALPGDVETYGRMIDFAERHGGRAQRAIIALNLETDILDYAAKPVLRPDAAPAAKAGLGLLRLKVLLTRHSALYFSVTQLVHRTPWLRDTAVQLGLIAPNLQASARKVPTNESVEATIVRTMELAARKQSTVLVIPSRYIWHGDQSTRLAQVHERIVVGLAERGVDVVDLRPVFEAGGTPLDYHFENDGHWRPTGHALAAETLARHLRERHGNAL